MNIKITIVNFVNFTIEIEHQPGMVKINITTMLKIKAGPRRNKCSGCCFLLKP